MKSLLLTILIVLNFSLLNAQKKIILHVTPVDAEIYLKYTGDDAALLGRGTVDFKLKGDQTTVYVSKPGYQTEKRVYIKHGMGTKTDQIVLKNRLMKITAGPYNADIYIDGVYIGKGSTENSVIIKENSSTLVEVKCKGYVPLSKTYFNISGRDIPPLSEILQLEDRLVNVSVKPSGTEIYVDNIMLGKDAFNVIVPYGTCVIVKISKSGYADIEKSYCNKDHSLVPPVFDNFVLEDRIVQINTTPETAEIKVEGIIVGTGSHNLLIPKGRCIEVEIMHEGFDNQKKNYCNTKDRNIPPPTDHIELQQDESWASSIQSDQANINFSVSVNPNTSEDKAWKIISQIVMDKFDVLEITDKFTGYIRTAWAIKVFSNGTTIRTRIIIKGGGDDPLRYIIKIVSEESDEPGVSVKDDEKFKEWDRILNTYKDVISEVQARLQ